MTVPDYIVIRRERDDDGEVILIGGPPGAGCGGGAPSYVIDGGAVEQDGVHYPMLLHGSSCQPEDERRLHVLDDPHPTRQGAVKTARRLADDIIAEFFPGAVEPGLN